MHWHWSLLALVHPYAPLVRLEMMRKGNRLHKCTVSSCHRTEYHTSSLDDLSRGQVCRFYSPVRHQQLGESRSQGVFSMGRDVLARSPWTSGLALQLRCLAIISLGGVTREPLSECALVV